MKLSKIVLLNNLVLYLLENKIIDIKELGWSLSFIIKLENLNFDFSKNYITDIGIVKLS